MQHLVKNAKQKNIFSHNKMMQWTGQWGRDSDHHALLFASAVNSAGDSSDQVVKTVCWNIYTFFLFFNTECYVSFSINFFNSFKICIRDFDRNLTVANRYQGCVILFQSDVADKPVRASCCLATCTEPSESRSDSTQLLPATSSPRAVCRPNTQKADMPATKEWI